MGGYIFDPLPPILSSLTQLVINSPDNSSCVGSKSQSTVIYVTVQDRRVESTIQANRMILSMIRMCIDQNNYANGNQ